MSNIFDIEESSRNMPFHEKSAWIMSVVLLLGGVFYGVVVTSLSAELGRLAPPNLPTVVVYTVILTVLAVVGHIVAAITAPKEASAPLDERERRITDRAGHLSSYFLGAGVLLALTVYLFSYDGNVLFYGVFASLMLSQLAEYVLQIFFYRSFV